MTDSNAFDFSELNLRSSAKEPRTKAYHIPASGSNEPSTPPQNTVYDLDADLSPVKTPTPERASPAQATPAVPAPLATPEPLHTPTNEPVARPVDTGPITTGPVAAGPIATGPATTGPIAPSPFEADAAPVPVAETTGPARAGARAPFNPIAALGRKKTEPDLFAPGAEDTTDSVLSEFGPASGLADSDLDHSPAAVAAVAPPAIDIAVDTLIEHPAPKPGRRDAKRGDAPTEPPPLELRDVREFVDPSRLAVDELDKLEGVRVHPPRRAVNKYILVLDEFENTPGLLDTFLREHAMSVAGVNVQPNNRDKKNPLVRACVASWVYGPVNAARHGSRRLFQRARSKVMESWLRQTRHPIRPATTCTRYGVKVDGFADVNSPEFRKMLAERGVELLVCIGSHQVFGDHLRGAVPFGVINVHGSLLPHYRGQAPTLHTLADNQRTCGVSVHYATRHLNDGPVLAERAYTVHTHDTLADVNRRSREVAGDALLQAVRKIEHGTLTMASNPETTAMRCGQPRRRDVRLVRKSGRKVG